MNGLLGKYKGLNVRAKAALWFTICSFLQKGISFITVPIFTRVLTTEEYGTYSVYLSWLQILTVLSSLYLYYGVTDNAMSKFENDRSRFLSSMQGLTVSITTCLFLFSMVTIDGLSHMMKLAPVMILLMFAEIYVTPSFAFWSARQRFEYKYRKLVALTLVKSFLNPTLGLIAVTLSNDKALARVVSTVAVEIMICGSIMILQFYRGKVFFDKKYWKYALQLAIPMLPHYLSGIILNQGDRIMISNMIGKSEVALYGVAYSIGMLVQIFVTAINNALTPWVYGRLKATDIKSIQEKSRGVMLFVFLISIGLMLISPELVLIFGSSKYAGSTNVIPPVAGSVFFIFMYSFLSYPEFYYEKTSFLMIASLAAAGLNIGLNYIFISAFGYVAAAYTTLACYSVYSLGHYFVGGKILYKETNEKSVVDVSLAAILSLFVIIVSTIIHMVFPYTILRYSIIGIGAVVAYIKRDFIINLVRPQKRN